LPELTREARPDAVFDLMAIEQREAAIGAMGMQSMLRH
jgi:hypothetical protein